jgi:hypothetical protein
MEFEQCFKAGTMAVCMTGMLMGVLLTILLVVLYSRMRSERFMDPNDFDPQTKALLLAHERADPSSGIAMMRMYGSHM